MPRNLELLLVLSELMSAAGGQHPAYPEPQSRAHTLGPVGVVNPRVPTVSAQVPDGWVRAGARLTGNDMSNKSGRFEQIPDSRETAHGAQNNRPFLHCAEEHDR